MGLVMIPLPFVEGFVLLSGVLFLAGFAISPTLIASAAWIEEIVPADRLTEALTVFTTGLGAGIAPGAALVGVVVDARGASASYWVCAVAGLTGALVAFVTARVASPGRPSPTGSSASEPLR
jgi:predicted MFS family arabinose efflux permease